ncbi:MAG TPA: maleylpyruvate isomerase family mycothiol-dependent enzyme [Acidimicrobiales bacterium]|nr:maleylpyruvate isomerase family mycothiol-dependent enzyme [Acidimicrobiales bacterium]
MTLQRTVVVPGMLAEYGAFAELLRSLSDDELTVPSRCEGWTAADVAGHVVGQLSDVANLRLQGLGTPEATQREVMERRGRTAAELAGELEAALAIVGDLAAGFDDDVWDAPGPQGDGTTLGFGVEALWFDTFLHADDIRAAVGRATVSGPGLAPSVSHITQVLTEQGWGPATVRLDGLDEFSVSGGGGITIDGDPMTFVLVASGRSDPGVLGLDETVNIFR